LQIVLSEPFGLSLYFPHEDGNHRPANRDGFGRQGRGRSREGFSSWIAQGRNTLAVDASRS